MKRKSSLPAVPSLKMKVWTRLARERVHCRIVHVGFVDGQPEVGLAVCHVFDVLLFTPAGRVRAIDSPDQIISISDRTVFQSELLASAAVKRTLAGHVANRRKGKRPHAN